MKKIAVFNHFLDNIGGAEIVTLILARELAADVYTTNIDREKIKKMGFEDILPRIYSIGKVPINPPFKQQMAFLKFRFLNLKGQYDFFIIAGDWAISGAVNNKPNLEYFQSFLGEIWTSRNAIRNSLKPWMRPFYQLWTGYIRFFYRRYFKHVDRLVCNSKNTRDRIKRYLGKDSVVIYPPTDTSRYHFSKSKNFWLSVNRLVLYKRIELQLRAFSKLPGENLVVVGSYEKGVRYFEEYKKYLESILPENVRLLTRVAGEELRGLYAQCKGLIATAFDEPFGMTTVEAMASGKPIIAAAEGGHKESVIDGVTGILIKDINEDKLAEAVKFIGENHQKYKEACLKQAQKFDKKVFIWKIKREIANYYN